MLQNINFSYLNICIPFALITFVFILLSRLVIKWIKISRGLALILLWAATINLVFIFDFINLSPIIVYFIFLILIFGFSIYSLVRFKIHLKSFFKIENLKSDLKLFVTWFIAFLILLIPMFIVFKSDTLIPGANISTDSLVHSFLAEGIQKTTEIGLNPYWNNEYPRAFHSFIYYISNLIPIDDVRALLLPGVMFSFSFMVFAAEDILNFFGFRGKRKHVVMLMTICSGLILSTAYALFVPQVAVIPLLITAVFNIIILKKNERGRLLTILILAIVITGIYGIYAVNIIFVAAAVKFLYELRLEIRDRRLKIHTNLISNLKSLISKDSTRFLIPLILICLLAIPTLISFYNNTFSSFKNSDITFNGTGNLTTSGFLSPYHITGLWMPNLEYRDSLGPFAVYVMAAILLIQAAIIIKSKLNKEIILMNIIFGGMMLAGVFVFRNQYIHFKYLTYFIPVFLLTFGISLFSLKLKYKIDYLIAFLFIIAFAALTIFLVKSYKPLTVNDSDRFNLLEGRVYSNKTQMLVMSDVWVQYYANKDGVYTPLADYAFPTRRYNGQSFDLLIFDKKEKQPNLVKDYLDKHPDIKAKMDVPSYCVNDFMDFEVYNLDCAAGNVF